MGETEREDLKPVPHRRHKKTLKSHSVLLETLCRIDFKHWTFPVQIRVLFFVLIFKFSFIMENETCFWRGLFDTNEQNVLQEGMIATGIFSVTLSAWVTGTILLTDLRSSWSYKNLANFYIIACIRRLLPTILNYLSVFFFFLSDVEKCDVDGFLETFFAVFEVEFLTHICIERYVIAKYVNNGWDLKKSHYTLYYFLSVMFSFLYSAPPLFGVVGFARDFTCTSCILDMIFPGTWENVLMIAIFVLRSVKPAIFMIIMLKWASKLERQCINCDKIDMQLTNSIVAITAAHFICWAPIVFIRGLVIISQLLNIKPMVYLCANWISWAMWMHWIAPAVSVIALFATNDRICYYSYGVFISSKPADDGKEKEH